MKKMIIAVLLIAPSLASAKPINYDRAVHLICENHANYSMCVEGVKAMFKHGYVAGRMSILCDGDTGITEGCAIAGKVQNWMEAN